MDSFNRLLQVADQLQGPEGCPWDQQQTFFSLQTYILEEAHEVIEAVDSQDDKKIVEELGDLLYTVVFYCKLAEKTGRFNTNDVIETVIQKLKRRHPHVFGDLKGADVETVIRNWERIKKEEQLGEQKSALASIPDTMPPLSKGQKTLKKIQRIAPHCFDERDSGEPFGEELVDLVLRAEAEGIDLEGSFRRAVSHYKSKFLEWESRK